MIKGELYNGDEALFNLFKSDKEAFFNCKKIIQWLPSLHRLGTEKNLFYYLSELGLSRASITTRPVLFCHAKDITTEEIYYKTPPHRDSYSVGLTEGAVVWSPLTEITKDMGPLEIIPGSHIKKQNLLRYEKSFGLEAGTKDEDFFPLSIEPGSAVIFHMNLVHRSGNNISDRIRYSMNFRYADLYSKEWISKKYHSPYVYSVKTDD